MPAMKTTYDDARGLFKFVLTMDDGRTLTDIMTGDEARALLSRGLFFVEVRGIMANLQADARDLVDLGL
jgi:hypothetical protein